MPGWAATDSVGELGGVEAGDGGGDPGGDLGVDGHQVLGLGTDVSGQRLGLELTRGPRAAAGKPAEDRSVTDKSSPTVNPCACSAG